MVSYQELRDLWRQLRDEPVLSVYLSASEHDPANRSAWRVRLQHLLEEASPDSRPAAGGGDPHENTSPRQARARFAAARDHILAALQDFTGFLPGPGWAAFATADGLRWAGSLPAPVADRVRWSRGPALATHIRALKQGRPVAVALVDSRRARLFRYVGGDVEEVIDFRGITELGDLTDATTSKRATTHSGVRGETGRDAARRSLEVELERLVDEVAAAVGEIAGEHGLVILGGAAEATTALRRVLNSRYGDHLREDPALHLTMTAAEVRAAAGRDASELSRAMHARLVDRLLDEVGARGRARAGIEGVKHALELGQAATLFLSERFVDESPDRADALVGLALDSDAAVEVVAGPGAQRLDEAAGGVAARLRYTLSPAGEAAGTVGRGEAG